MPKDQGLLIKTESKPSQLIKTEEIKKEENTEVKNEQLIVKQEIDVKTESNTEPKVAKTENEDEQNVKIDVTNSPTGCVNIKYLLLYNSIFNILYYLLSF